MSKGCTFTRIMEILHDTEQCGEHAMGHMPCVMFKNMIMIIKITTSQAWYFCSQILYKILQA